VLDELIQAVAEKAGRPGTVADSASFQEGLANVEAVVRSARAFVFETWNDAWATLSRGEKLSVRQGTLIRLALAHGLRWRWLRKQRHDRRDPLFRNGDVFRLALDANKLPLLVSRRHAGCSAPEEWIEHYAIRRRHQAHEPAH